MEKLKRLVTAGEPGTYDKGCESAKVGVCFPTSLQQGHESDVPGDTFEAYVPQVQVKGFSFPLITCDIRGIHQRFIGWKDEDGDHAEHVLFDDLPKVVTGNNKKPIFSIIKHWDPPPYGSEGYAQTRI